MNTLVSQGAALCVRISLCRAVLFIGRNGFHFIRRTVHFHVVAQSVSTGFRLINIKPAIPYVDETLGGCRQEPNNLVLLLKDKLGHDFLAMAALAPGDYEAMVKT